MAAWAWRHREPARCHDVLPAPARLRVQHPRWKIKAFVSAAHSYGTIERPFLEPAGAGGVEQEHPVEAASKTDPEPRLV